MYKLNTGKSKILTAALICSLSLGLFLSGCENPGQTSSQAENKHKLTVSENKKLQQQLEKAREKNDRLEKQLKACREKINTLRTNANKDLQEQIQPLIGTIMDEHSKLKEENKQLKAKIEKLKEAKTDSK